MFKEWLSPARIDELLSDPEVQVATKLVYRFPDVEQGFVAPLSLPAGTPKDETLSAGRIAELAFFDRFPDTGELRRELEAAFETSNYGIGIMRIRTSSPSQLLTWWSRHQDVVRFVQPIVSDLDESSQVFDPGEPIE